MLDSTKIPAPLVMPPVKIELTATKYPPVNSRPVRDTAGSLVIDMRLVLFLPSKTHAGGEASVEQLMDTDVVALMIRGAVSTRRDPEETNHWYHRRPARGGKKNNKKNHSAVHHAPAKRVMLTAAGVLSTDCSTEAVRGVTPEVAFPVVYVKVLGPAGVASRKREEAAAGAAAKATSNTRRSDERVIEQTSAI